MDELHLLPDMDVFAEEKMHDIKLIALVWEEIEWIIKKKIREGDVFKPGCLFYSGMPAAFNNELY